MSEKECPAPATRTVRPARRPRSARRGSRVARARPERRTARATSSTTWRDCYPPHELGARARGAAPPRGARARDGRRGARRAPARDRAPDRARADRAAVRPGHASTRPARSPASATYDDDGELAGFLPANWSSARAGSTGAAAVVQGDDFTVRGGAADAAIWQKMVYAERLAHELRLPLVRLVDGTGGGGSVKSLETMGFTYVPFIPGWDAGGREPRRACRWWRRRSGPVAGLGAARVVASHFSRDRARHGAAVRRRAAGGGGRDGRDARQGGARRRARRRRARARSTTRRPTRTTRSRRSSASSPTCRRTCGRLPPVARPQRPGRPPRGGRCSSIVPRDRAQALQGARDPRGGASTAARCSSSARATAAR